MNAKPSPVTLSPKQIMLELLCSFVALAVKQSPTTAALIPGILLAAMDMPTPVPQQSIPSVHSPDFILLATAT